MTPKLTPQGPSLRNGAGKSKGATASSSGQQQEQTEPKTPHTTPESIPKKPSENELNVKEFVDESVPYPNYADDPDPLPMNSTKTAQTAKLKEMKEYTQGILAAYQKTKMRGEILWKDFITAFRPHTIRSWPRTTVIEWRDFLMQRGIFIDTERTKPPVESIIETYYIWRNSPDPKKNPHRKSH